MMNNLKIRLGEEYINNQGCLMKIIEYNNANNIIVEFQDDYQGRVHTKYINFRKGQVKNPYHPSVYGVGIVGNKYLKSSNNKHKKEYSLWFQILRRCYDEKQKNINPTYQDVICCDEWLNYENFYEWLHLQPNFDKWYNNKGWDIDKDILVKGNKIYSPETCCLVNEKINNLFTKSNSARGEYPIGVIFSKNHNCFVVQIGNQITKKRERHFGFNTPEEAFKAYKNYKENIIKQIAQEEYDKGNITQKCYETMMRYEVEITD